MKFNRKTNADITRGNAAISFTLLAFGTVIGLAATDLILPAIPQLPQVFGGSAEAAQYVLAMFIFGHALGLLAFGSLGARYSQRWLLIASSAGFSVVSIACATSDTMQELIFIRAMQGFLAAAPAVFAPGMIKHSFDEKQAVQAYGLIGSIESMAPAFAPVIGAWLLAIGSWRTGFEVTAGAALLLTICLLTFGRHMPKLPRAEHAPKPSYKPGSGFLKLLCNLAFLRHSLSHAFNLGGLLLFVLSAPAIITGSMNGQIDNFIIMQIVGIVTFIIAANRAAMVRVRLGAERQMLLGGVISLTGALAMTSFALFGNNDPRWLVAFFFPVNIGLGLRGPVIFMEAMKAAGDDSARGGALLGLFILLTAAIGTSAVAPFISFGLFPAAFGMLIMSVLCLMMMLLPRQ